MSDFKIDKTMADGVEEDGTDRICAYCAHFCTNGEPFGICGAEFMGSVRPGDTIGTTLRKAVEASVPETHGCWRWEEYR